MSPKGESSITREELIRLVRALLDNKAKVTVNISQESIPRQLKDEIIRNNN